MERKAIYFGGDISTWDLKFLVKSIPKSFKVTDIVINGDITDDDDEFSYNPEIIQVPVNLCVCGSINLPIYCTLKVLGDFEGYGDIDASKISVAENFFCKGDVDASDIEAGGDVIIDGNLDTGWGEVKTLGSFLCYGNCKSNVRVREFFLCTGEFKGDINSL